MTAFDGARHLDLVVDSPPRTRTGLRWAWDHAGPVMLIAAAAGMYVGTLAAVVVREWSR